MWVCIAPRREDIFKVLGYGTHSQGISQFYLYTPRSSANRMNHTMAASYGIDTDSDDDVSSR